MNILGQKITSGLALALLLNLTSCQQDNLLSPNQPGSARLATPDDSISGSTSLVHKLTRYGDAKLSYGPNGELIQVTTPVRGALSIQTDYTYSPGKIRAFTHQGRAVVHDETFTLDEKGRCTGSLEKGLDVQDDRKWTFTYYDNGQLSARALWHASGSILYNYNVDGDVNQVRIANTPAGELYINFTYDKTTTNKYPLNVNILLMAANDPYLRIFGKPSKHLLKQVSYAHTEYDNHSPLPSDLNYTYTFDADGFVTKKMEENVLTGVVSSTTLCEYILPYLVKQL